MRTDENDVEFHASEPQIEIHSEILANVSYQYRQIRSPLATIKIPDLCNKVMSTRELQMLDTNLRIQEPIIIEKSRSTGLSGKPVKFRGGGFEDSTIRNTVTDI